MEDKNTQYMVKLKYIKPIKLPIVKEQKLAEFIPIIPLEEDKYIKGKIEGIGYEYFKLNKELFKEGRDYYGRLDMPFFPKREVPVFFKAISKKEGKIKMLHERDEKDWNAYVVARERVMIRQMRAKK